MGGSGIGKPPPHDDNRADSRQDFEANAHDFPPSGSPDNASSSLLTD
jgi:hypothetical protein